MDKDGGGKEVKLSASAKPFTFSVGSKPFVPPNYSPAPLTPLTNSITPSSSAGEVEDLSSGFANLNIDAPSWTPTPSVRQLSGTSVESSDVYLEDNKNCPCCRGYVQSCDAMACIEAGSCQVCTDFSFSDIDDIENDEVFDPEFAKCVCCHGHYLSCSNSICRSLLMCMCQPKIRDEWLPKFAACKCCSGRIYDCPKINDLCKAESRKSVLNCICLNQGKPLTS